MDEEYQEAIDFLKQTFRGWISNMMTDFDAQGIDMPPEAVVEALSDLADEISGTVYGDVDDFLDDVFKDE